MTAKNTDKIALMQLKAIGDTLMCEPSVRAVRKAFPAAEITFITSDVAYPILKNHPDIDKFIIWEKKTPLLRYLKFLLSLARNRYDCLIDFQKNTRSYTFAHLIRARAKISFRSNRRNSGYTVLLPGYDLQKYVPYEKLRLVEYLVGGPVARAIPKVYVSQADLDAAGAIYRQLGYSETDTVAVVSPVSKVLCRLWKPENFARLCDFIQANYAVKLLFTWGPGEKHIVERVLASMQTSPPDTNYAIDSLQVLTALYAKAKLWIGNDSGPRHLAIGEGIPTFAPFGHFKWRHWTPPDTGIHACVEPDNHDPHYKGYRIDSLAYAKVENHCKAWLDQLTPEKSL